MIYIEHKNMDYKQSINPSVSSQRTLRQWLRNIENKFSEKVIDKKIEELDKVIKEQKNRIASNDQKVEEDSDDEIIDEVMEID